MDGATDLKPASSMVFKRYSVNCLSRFCPSYRPCNHSAAGQLQSAELAALISTEYGRKKDMTVLEVGSYSAGLRKCGPITSVDLYLM